MMTQRKPLILIIDDNQENLKVIGNMLKEHNYSIAVATGGEEAFELLWKNLPDLMLLDIMMPGMDGYEVCKKLKTEKRTKDIPVIFLSAKGETDDIVKGFEAGGVDYVSKPFNSRELLARIKTHIELKRARDEINLLKGIIPICSKCKKIRDDSGYWKQVEEYIESRSDAEFTHSVCPTCARELYGDLYDEKK